MSTSMERAVVLRSLSCTPLVCTRFFARSSSKLSRLSPLYSLSRCHRSVSLLRHHLRPISTTSRPSTQLRRHFSSLSPRAIATPPAQPCSEVVVADDVVAEKLGFDKVSEQFIEECKSIAVLYKHKKTGAEIMSVSNDDENKVFGIVFRTPPKDSTGIPHILEHSVLCGSRKYPLKEPFVELLKGSLHTFLNAFTYPDRTCYPVASTNTKDFYNLVDVYLDAVFFPKCVEDFQTFQQEGWHYELNNPSEDITYKDNTYGVDSGGDPQVIPKLTFEEFKEFHRKYYHPSNARIWFYGDDDPNERLRILSEYLDTFDASSASSESKIHPQKLFSKPVRIVEKYPAAEALGFLDHLMLGTPASPLRKILLESGLGDAIVGGGVEDELLQPQFSIGLKGVSEDDIKTALMLRSIVSMLCGSCCLPKWCSIAFLPKKPLIDLKARIAAEGSKAVFAPLIEKFILNNPHLVTIEMQPDPEKASRDEAAEREILNKAKASMTEEDLAELARATQELRLKQETPDPPEALKTVPSLSLSDIPKKPTFVPIEVGDINGVKILQHDLFTNDVLYAEVVFNMSSLKQELLPLVPLFCQSLLEMGTKDMDFVQLNQLIGRKTGGISVYPSTSSIRGKEDPCSHIIVRGKAMSGRTEDLFNLVNCILQDVQFTDQKRFKQFVSQSKARMESRLRGSGHGIAAARMDAKLNVAGWISEQMGGVSYLEFLQALEKKVDEDWDGISSSLEEIRRSLISRNDCLVNLTADGKTLTNSEKFISKFIDLLPSTPSIQSASWNARLPSTNEAIVIPTQVNYVGKAANIYDTGYELKGSSYVISKHISNTWLWDRVRVSGGAYGGFCDFDTHSGIFSFLSYRDPNLLKTLDIYDATGDFLRELEMDNDTLTKAIIGTIGDVDAYQLPDAKGYSSLLRYLLGVTEEERQKRREEILSTSLSDFKEFADAIDAIKDKGVVVAVASSDDIDAANKERSNFLEVKKVL
ncbi:presequence protease 1 [Actinidia rufa]|uniref:Presequence protease 1 n=1 Tax=Actinidia rufa TaxID=165716 RepID=A0A7J0ETS0_9ERIC|nr:presequence protease 1 [Actinidia rufa]